jgi:hypothetical protein
MRNVFTIDTEFCSLEQIKNILDDKPNLALSSNALALIDQGARFVQKISLGDDHDLPPLLLMA